MVIDPSFAQDKTAETAGGRVPVVAGVGGTVSEFESVGGSTNTNDGLAGFNVIGKVAHLIIGKVAKASEQDE